jgi:hypothetical protein
MKALGVKAWGIIVAAFGFLLMLLRLKNNKIEELEHSNEVHEEAKEIREGQTLDKQEVLNDEKSEIKKANEEDESMSDLDKLNSL